MSTTSVPTAQDTKPHPFLESPQLYSQTLPDSITETHLQKPFCCLSESQRPGINFKCLDADDSGQGMRFACLHFKNAHSAELALAMLDHGVKLRTGSDSDVELHLSHARPDTFPTVSVRDSNAYACLVKPVNASVKLPGMKVLFAALRVFGPIFRLREETNLGRVVQFWKENDSIEARKAIIHIEGKGVQLQALNSKTVHCRNVPNDDQVIRTFFEDCGTILKVIISKSSTAFITFSSEKEAIQAIKTKTGKTIPGQSGPSQVFPTFTKQKEKKAPKSGLPPAEPTAAKSTDTATTQESAQANDDAATNKSETCSEEEAMPATLDTAQSPNIPAGHYQQAPETSNDDTAPPGTLDEQWDQTWHSEAPRLQKELTLTESEKLFIDEERQRLETTLSQTRTEKYSLEDENRRLSKEYNDMQTQVEELLNQQESWLLEKGESKELRMKLDATEKDLDDTRRALAVALSRQKMLELERLEWLASKGKEQEKEVREQEAVRCREQERRNQERQRQDDLKKEEERLHREKILEEERARAEQNRREAAEAARKAREERERLDREREEAERREREKKEEVLLRRRWAEATKCEEERCRKRDREWMPGLAGWWTTRRAFDRFLILLDDFANTKFTEDKPLTAGSIPWPVLENPCYELDVASLEWETVETFFKTIRSVSQTPQDFDALIQRVHLAFHPDRWAARKILKSVMDDDQRKALEQAGNIVSQAVTPLWKETKA